jgi:2-iminobutanoate/2-iminopropanoate deaminase
VKCNVHLTDMADFEAISVADAETLHPHRPARTTIGVSALPIGARVEIEAVARTSR